MSLTNDFDAYIAQRKPIFAYNPQGITNLELLVAVSKAGGIGLVNLERLQLSESKKLIQSCYSTLKKNWGVRVSTKDQLKMVLTLHDNSFPLLLIINDIGLSPKLIEQINSKKIILIAEVLSLQEAYTKRWAQVFIVKGNEAAGKVGDETTFILAQQFADSGLPFITQGGVGLYTTPVIFTAGAKGVILDTQLYLTPESPLPAKVKDFISKLDPTDTKIVGDSTNYKYRVYARLGTKIVKDYLQKEKDLISLSKEKRTIAFQKEIISERTMFDSQDILNSLLPVGQDVSFAKILTNKFKTTQGIIEGLLAQTSKQLKLAVKNYPLRENVEVAQKLGIKYPLIQGPMANVSESPAFALEIAKAGALPFLALGSLFKGQTRTLISKTKEVLGSRPFGCGIIGLEANYKARDEHLKILKELKPQFVVVAAGTIDQAKQVMKYGSTTFLHSPSPVIFREAIESDVNYFVLEGMECGGHIGILTSFVLWELALNELWQMKDTLSNANRKVNVAFAGGIGERYSAAMVGVLGSAMPEIMNSILWVGSAYILVKEIVDTGAIKPLYQQLALNAKETMVLGETVNTRARSLPTPCARIIIKRELERLEQGISLKERKHQYERDNLGSTRIAALGEIWNPDGEDDKPNRFMPVDEKVQYQKGNYLMGQIVSNLRCVRTINDLHTDLIINSEEIVKVKINEVNQRISSNRQSTQKPSLEPVHQEFVLPEIDSSIFEGEGIAVVGLGCIFPDAPNVETFWSNILNRVYSIKEIPAERWLDNVNLFYSEDKSAPNKTYSKIAATISDFKFNSLEFRIPPKVALTMGNSQKFALVAAKEALIDAQMFAKDYDNNRTAVIIGNSMGDEIRTSHTHKVFVPEVLASIEKSSFFSELESKNWSKLKQKLLVDYETRLIPINEDSMPGELSNVIAGRVANTFNLRGKNMTTDAACASSLAALNVATKGLLDFEYDAVLVGGVDCSLDVPTFVKFSKIGALSAEGSFPFDIRANGFVMGEGAGFCILKRLSDAIKDGNKIYATIKGLGASSDGKGKGITAPNPLGQKLAVERALKHANIKMEDLQLIEAHGTSTSVGDPVELQVLTDLATNIAPATIALGSIKSQIGHLKSAAGIASLIKTSLALYHKILPPSINFETPNPIIDWKVSPFFVNIEHQEWVQPAHATRMAGVSSFGFGGTNYHTIMEEYVPGITKGNLPIAIPTEEIQRILKGSVLAQRASTTSDDFEVTLDQSKWQTHFEQVAKLETEALFFGAETIADLESSIDQFRKTIPRSTFEINGIGPRVRDITHKSTKQLKGKIRAAVTCSSLENLPSSLDNLLSGLQDKSKRSFLQNKGIFYSEEHSLGKIAFLFPGQGSQYVRMGKELWIKYQIVRDTFAEADKITSELMNFSITDVIFSIGKSEAESKELLRQTEITQPAIFALNIAIYRLLRSFGIKPDFVAGHSLGEYSALVASGILSFEDGLRAVVPRGQAMAEFDSKDKGIMASIGAGYKEIDTVLEKIDGYVIAANKNTPKQTVISGATPAVQKAMKIFAEKGIPAVPLTVSAAFHSQIVAPAVDHMRISLEKLQFNKPEIPISSNVTGKLYPKTRGKIIDLLCQQICSPVEWIKQVTSMYKDHGVRTFIEIGPKYVLTSFTRATLERHDDFIALASNHPKKGAMQHFSEVIAALGVMGYPLTMPALSSDVYTQEFRNPLERFYVKQPIIKQLPTTTVVKDSPFDVLLDNDLRELSQDDAFKDYLELQAPAIGAFLKVGYDTYKEKIASAIQEKKLMDKLQINTEAIGITGISIGLPGKNRNVFDDTNFDAILAGENFIEQIPVELREKMVDKNIVRLVKDAIKGAQFQTITDVGEVIKLAAQRGKFDLSKEYGVNADFTAILDITFQLAFAAGIEALRDAGIPLVPMKTKTSVGKEISKGWALPESMRDDTGIVFASAFPAYNNLINIVSEFLNDKYRTKNREELHSLYQELISKITDASAKQRITKWFEDNKILNEGEEDERFQFSRKFLFEILSMGHSQFAQFIRARGPNTQVNAACSSTTQAIAIGEDWIRTGRCNRVIVVAADDITNAEMLEWFGSGFLAVGAATTEGKVEEAALPFDKRRHGMIIGMGAAGVVLESQSAINTRGIKPIVDLLGTHIVNSAYHGTRLDRNHISSQMNEFISKIEKRFNISREEIASELVFISHETYTPARGGSASAEVDALRKTFGAKIDDIVIANTKGFTGHAMGAGIEDVVAVKILEKGIVPPVANWKEQDPELGKLNLSKGGPYDVKYALRFAAGFGSQLTLALYRLNTKEGRFASGEYDRWLQSLKGTRDTLEVVNKTLRLLEDPKLISRASQQIVSPTPPASSSNLDKGIITTIVSLISEKTGYPVDMIEANMHLEEDLGIDTVKQAELFGMIRSKYNLPREEGVRIQEYFSVNKIAEYVTSKIGGGPSTAQAESTTETIPQTSQRKEIVSEITKLIAEKTGYPDDMVEPEMELEEDLGIDTVKQAEMFGIIRTKWDLPREEGVRIQEYSTVNKIADYILDRLKSGTSSQPASQQIVDADPGGSTFDSIPGRRLNVQLINAPKINVEKKSLAKKKFVVAGVSNQFTDDLLAALEKRKAKIIKFIDLKKVNTSEKIQNELSEVITDGLIYIEPTTTKNNKHNLSARVLFALCKTVEFTEEPFILTINNSNSAFGWNSKVAPITGSITGFTKALAREFSKGSVKTVSCTNPELAITELCAGDGTVEVAFDEHGTRMVFVSQELPITKIDDPFAPDESDLMVISGGAQGITFEITKKIAENYKPKIALLGRTTLPSNITEIANLDEPSLAALKEKMVADLKLTTEKVTPVMMQKEWSKITKAIAVKKAIELLEQNGSSTRYYSVNVVDKESTSKVIQQISQDFGQEITGLIHGAGLESSKLIANKKFDDFNLVYNVKAIGFDNLVDSLNLKTLKFVTCFSSVAGRFGNAGQVDYSAANDYLSKSCWQLRAHGIHATSICWSAWAEVGMATRGSVMKVLEYAGVTPLSIEDGVNAFINELENGQDAEVVIAGKLGFLLETPLPFVKVNQKNFPLIGSIKRNFDGSILTERLFSLENDLYLNHHRFDEIPYLPGVMGLELFSELAKLVYPKKTLIRFEDVNFASAVKFKNDQPRKLKARITNDESPTISLESDFEKDGVKVGDPRTHFNAKLIFGKKAEKTIPRVKLKSGNLIDNSKLYEILPHGSLFQILKDVNDIDGEIISKTAKPKQKQFAWEIKGFTSKPLAIEAAFQTMGLLDAVKSNKMGLPFGIKTLQFYNSKEDPALVRGTKMAVTEYGSLYNFEVVSKTGQVILDAQGYATVHVDFGVNLTNIDEIRLNRVKRLFNLPAGTILEITDVKVIQTLVENDKNVLTSFLHPDEQVKFSKFTVKKRKHEWLSGVIAIKTALQKLIPDVASNKIKIEKNELGKPYIKLGSKSKPIHISITHSNGYAVGIINPTKNTGIDLEVIEKRSASIIDEVLSPKEQDFLKQQQKDLTDELLTKIWAAKEAATKVLGVGLNIDLHDLIVGKLQDQEITLQIDSSKLPEKERSQYKNKNLVLSAKLSRDDEFVAAVCQFK